MNGNDQQIIAQKIRTRYIEKEHTELDELRELDARVTRPARLFSYILGSIGAVIMGSGMSLVMTDIAKTLGISGDPTAMGIIIGVVGLGIALINYPLHGAIINSRKKKYAPEIIRLSNEIINK